MPRNRNRSKKKSTTPGGAAQRRTQRESEDISDMGSPDAYGDEDDRERGYDEALDFPSSVMIRKGPWEGKEYTVVVYTETNFSWEVQQRYSKFDSLKNGLVSQRGWKTAVEALEFPKKTMSSAPTEERRATLETWMNSVLAQYLKLREQSKSCKGPGLVMVNEFLAPNDPSDVAPVARAESARDGAELDAEDQRERQKIERMKRNEARKGDPNFKRSKIQEAKQRALTDSPSNRHGSDSDESDEEDGPWHRTCCGLTEHERCPDACVPLPGQAVDGCAALCAKLPGLCKWLYESCAAGCAKSAKCLAENETTAKACPCLSSYAELDSEDEDDEEQGRRRSATAPARTGGSSKKGSAPRPQKMKAMA